MKPEINKNIIVIVMAIIIFTLIIGLSMLVSDAPKERIGILKEKIACEKENSGYNVCMKQVKEGNKDYRDCSVIKLAEQGYTDGINCMSHFNNPICIGERYDAEVHADNLCKDEQKEKSILSSFDCYKLLANL